MKIFLPFLMFWCCNIAISQTKIADEFKAEVDKATSKLNVRIPEHVDPVMVNATLVWNKSRDQVAIVVKAAILNGWHIYALVPPTQPYIQYDMVLQTPEGLEAITEWEKPKPYPYEEGTYTYKGVVVFTKYFKVKNPTDKSLKAGLFYQTCNISQCLRPNEKVIELNL